MLFIKKAMDMSEKASKYLFAQKVEIILDLHVFTTIIINHEYFKSI
jgi:hypothetical protein